MGFTRNCQSSTDHPSPLRDCETLACLMRDSKFIAWLVWNCKPVAGLLCICKKVIDFASNCKLVSGSMFPLQVVPRPVSPSQYIPGLMSHYSILSHILSHLKPLWSIGNHKNVLWIRMPISIPYRTLQMRYEKQPVTPVQILRQWVTTASHESKRDDQRALQMQVVWVRISEPDAIRTFGEGDKTDCLKQDAERAAVAWTRPRQVGESRKSRQDWGEHM